MGPSARKPALLVSIAVALLTLLAPACSDNAVSVDVDEVVARALAAPGSVASYQMDYLASEHIRGEIDGDRARGELSMDASAAVDTANRMMRLDMAIEFGGSVFGGYNMEMHLQDYIIGDEVYAGILVDDYPEEPQWTKIDRDIWDGIEVTGQLLALLEEAEPEYGGEEEVDGVGCYVLEMTPSGSGIMSLYTWQGISAGETEVPRFKAEHFRSAQARLWIDRDTARTVKACIDVTLHMQAEELSETLGSGEVDVEVEGEILFHHYNEPVSIEVPPAVIERTS